TNVTGTAALAGTVRLLPGVGTYDINHQYVLIHANGGVSGTFGTTDFTSGFGAGLRPQITYDANNVFLTFQAGTLSPFLPAGATITQRNVAGAVDAGIVAGNTPPSFLPLLNVPASSLPRALDQLSGEIHTGTATAGFQSMDQFLRLMLDPFLENRI